MAVKQMNMAGKSMSISDAVFDEDVGKSASCLSGLAEELASCLPESVEALFSPCLGHTSKVQLASWLGVLPEA